MPDLISQHRISLDESRNKNLSKINKHGLIKTPYNVNLESKKNNKGILISGNSSAAGFPLTKYGENIEDTFVSRLELDLRMKNYEVDVVNLANFGWNSWQEYTQQVRYYNSEPFFDDLPKVYISASIGGIQDFWLFVNLISREKNYINQFYQANELMSWDSSWDQVLKKLSNALHGDIKSGLDIFKSSVIKNIKNRYTYKFLSNLFLKIKNKKYDGGVDYFLKIKIT